VAVGPICQLNFFPSLVSPSSPLSLSSPLSPPGGAALPGSLPVPTSLSKAIAHGAEARGRGSSAPPRPWAGERRRGPWAGELCWRASSPTQLQGWRGAAAAPAVWREHSERAPAAARLNGGGWRAAAALRSLCRRRRRVPWSRMRTAASGGRGERGEGLQGPHSAGLALLCVAAAPASAGGTQPWEGVGGARRARGPAGRRRVRGSASSEWRGRGERARCRGTAVRRAILPRRAAPPAAADQELELCRASLGGRAPWRLGGDGELRRPPSFLLCPRPLGVPPPDHLTAPQLPPRRRAAALLPLPAGRA